MSTEGAVINYMQNALNLTDSANDARTYVAIAIANAATKNVELRVPLAMVEAYRRLTVMADAEVGRTP